MPYTLNSKPSLNYGPLGFTGYKGHIRVPELRVHVKGGFRVSGCRVF